MHNIPLGGHEKALLLPHVIRYMIAAHTQVNILLGNPEIRKDGKRLIFLRWREHKNKCRNVHRGRKIKPTVAYTPLQRLGIHRGGTGIPFVHWHPPYGLLHPLIQPQLSEAVLLGGILPCRIARRLYLVYTDRDTERRIRPLPDLRVCPILILLCAVDHRIEGRVDLSPL